MRDRPAPRVLAWAAAQVGWPPDDIQIERMTGGYSWETYRLGWRRQLVVLRVAPYGGTMEPYEAAAEAIRLAAAPKSVPTPEVLAMDADGTATGRSCLLVQHLAGSAIRPGDTLDEHDMDRCRFAFGKALATIHKQGSTTDLSNVATVTDAYARAIEESVSHYRRASRVRHPGFEIGLRWLLTHVPRSEALPVLCHGDFRLANMLWKAPGTLSAVLDWERAWVGDPAADVAFTRMFSGWCAIEGAGQVAYETEMGQVLDEDRVGFAGRFERWRSYTSAMRALRAHAEGLTDDPRLERIGLAGDAGAWELSRLLSDGPLAPLPSVQWPDQPPDVSDLDPAEVVGILDDLRPYGDVVDDLGPAVRLSNPAKAYAAAYELLAAAAATGGAELIEPLRVLGRCARVRLDVTERR